MNTYIRLVIPMRGSMNDIIRMVEDVKDEHLAKLSDLEDILIFIIDRVENEESAMASDIAKAVEDALKIIDELREW